MNYLPESIRAEAIREDARYGGVRVMLLGRLGNARCTVQIDAEYGDAVTPDPGFVLFPVILEDHPSPRLLAYPKETVVAEKFEAMVSLGIANSRMKDYFDLYVMFEEQNVDRAILALAIRRTFDRRKTQLPSILPIGLSEEFSHHPTTIAQWQAFLARNTLNAPSLETVVNSIRRAIEPIMECIEGVCDIRCRLAENMPQAADTVSQGRVLGQTAERTKS